MIVNIGTAKIAPGTPHIQYQKISDRITATGFIVNRFASSIGVTRPVRGNPVDGAA